MRVLTRLTTHDRCRTPRRPSRVPRLSPFWRRSSRCGWTCSGPPECGPGRTSSTSAASRCCSSGWWRGCSGGSASRSKWTRWRPPPPPRRSPRSSPPHRNGTDMAPTVEQLTGHSGFRRGSPAVVVTDFQPLSAQRSLAAELSAAGADLTILRIDAVRDLAGGYSYRGLDELAETYAGLLADAGAGCVVGYCSASGLAERIAARLGLPVVLVKPTRPTFEQAVDDFGGFAAKLGSSADGMAFDPARGGAETHAAMNRGLAAALAGWALAEDIDADEVELLETELLARFDGWLGFLLAAAQHPDPLPRHHVVPGVELDDDMVAATVAAIERIHAERALGVDGDTLLGAACAVLVHRV